MGDVNVGDRVRVDRPAIEGVVNYVSSYSGLIDIDTSDGSLYATNHRDVVTKLASPLKVGDIIRYSDYSTVPTGTVVASSAGGTQPRFIRLPYGDWYDIDQRRSFDPRTISSGRKILYLPEP